MKRSEMVAVMTQVLNNLDVIKTSNKQKADAVLQAVEEAGMLPPIVPVGGNVGCLDPICCGEPDFSEMGEAIWEDESDDHT